jgi:hypothetical protein
VAYGAARRTPSWKRSAVRVSSGSKTLSPESIVEEAMRATRSTGATVRTLPRVKSATRSKLARKLHFPPRSDDWDMPDSPKAVVPRKPQSSRKKTPPARAARRPRASAVEEDSLSAASKRPVVSESEAPVQREAPLPTEAATPLPTAVSAPIIEETPAPPPEPPAEPPDTIQVTNLPTLAIDKPQEESLRALPPQPRTAAALAGPPPGSPVRSDAAVALLDLRGGLLGDRQEKRSRGWELPAGPALGWKAGASPFCRLTKRLKRKISSVVEDAFKEDQELLKRVMDAKIVEVTLPEAGGTAAQKDTVRVREQADRVRSHVKYATEAAKKAQQELAEQSRQDAEASIRSWKAFVGKVDQDVAAVATSIHSSLTLIEHLYASVMSPCGSSQAASATPRGRMDLSEYLLS